MAGSSTRSAWRTGTMLGFALALFATGAQAATSSAVTSATGAGACVVVLDCGGVTQQTVADAEGKFVFTNAPQGECTVRAVENATREAASGLPTGKRTHKPVRFQVTLDREAAATSPAASSDGAVKVVARGKGHELKGHVTLIK